MSELIKLEDLVEESEIPNIIEETKVKEPKVAEVILPRVVKRAKVEVVDPDVKPKKKRKRHFLNNADLLEETILSQEQGKMTDKLARMLMVLCDRYRASKTGNFTRYTYFDEMKSVATENLVKKAWHKFNAEKYTNAFAFYTQCVHNSYLQYLNYEKRHRNVRDALLVANGQTPSYKYLEEHSSKATGEYSSDDVVDSGRDLDYDTNLYD